MTNSKKKLYTTLFDTSVIKKDVNKRSIKSGIANLSSQSFIFLITIIRAAILARLLTPEDYGIFTMAVVISGFVLIFKDLGLSTATIREKEITHAQVSNLFWLNTFIGILSMVLVCATAPLLVWFYHDQRVAAVAYSLSPGFFFAGLTVQHQALLKRQMMFDKLAVINVSSSIASSLVGIFIAWIYSNYWALVWMQVIQNFFVMLGTWYSARWRPSPPRFNAGTKKLIKVGLDVAGLNAFSTITKQLDKVIAGRIVGAVPLGLYCKGQQIPNLIAGQFRMAIFVVALPALSALQGEPEKFADYYHKFQSAVCWITMMLSALCFVFAEEIIMLYFGPKWAGSVLFMRILSIQTFIMPAITTMDQIPLALGFSRRYLLGGMCRSIILVIGMILIAPFYGIAGIALWLALSDLVAFYPFARLCLKHSPVQIKRYLTTLLLPAVTGILLCIIFCYLKQYVFFDSMISQVGLMLLFMFSAIGIYSFFDMFEVNGTFGLWHSINSKIKNPI